MLASRPKHSNKHGKTRYRARKCNNICLKQLYILIKEKKKENKQKTCIHLKIKIIIISSYSIFVNTREESSTFLICM